MPLAAFLLAVTTTPAAVPAGKTAGWFTTADYPVDALIERQQGVVGFELQVDPGGKPVGCRVYRSSGSKPLDDITCDLAMKRARFKPGYRTRKIRRRRRERGQVIVRRIGKPVPSVYRHAVRWRLPNTNGTTDQTFLVHSRIAATGAVETCTITGPGAMGVGGSCGLFGSRGFLAGMLGSDYKRTATTDVRLALSLAAATPAKPAKTPDAYFLLAEAAVTFGPDGRLSDCTGLKSIRSVARSTDLCRLIKAQPPRIPAGSGERKAIYTLDLTASFR